MAEPTIICPKCKNEIKLTESLAAPLIESTRRDFENRLAQKDLDVAGREKSIREREEALSKAKDSLESAVRKICVPCPSQPFFSGGLEPTFAPRPFNTVAQLAPVFIRRATQTDTLPVVLAPP